MSMTEIDKLLEDRGSRYGDFGVQTQTARAIKDTFESAPNWSDLPPYMQEGLDLVATKLSRMLCGDYMYLDNVVDIIGYMTLVKTEMEKEHARIKKHAERILATQKNENPFQDPEVRAYYEDLRNDVPLINPLDWRGPYRNP